MTNLRKILDKYFYPPDVVKKYENTNCFVCGTPFSKAKWDRQKQLAHHEILALLPKKKEIKELKSKPCPYSDKIKCCTMQDYARNQCIDDIKEVLNG